MSETSRRADAEGARSFLTVLAALLALLGAFSGPWAVAVLSERAPLPPEAQEAAWRAAGGLWVLALGVFFLARRLPCRPSVRRVVSVAVSALAPLLALELCLAPHVESPTTLFLRDSDLGWRLRPGAEDYWGGVPARINARGLRGVERPPAKPPGTRRVLFLGDSVTFGFLIAEDELIFPALVEGALSTPARPVECINGAVGGYSPWQERLFLEGAGATYEPDLVLLCFVLNDVTEKLSLRRFSGGGEGAQLAKSRGGRAPVWLQESALFHFARRGWARLRLGPDVAGGAREREELGMYHLMLEPNRDDVQAAWRDTQASVQAIVEWCAARGVALGLVLFPISPQFADPARLSAPQWIMSRFAERRGVPCLDLLPALAEEAAARFVEAEALQLDAVHLSELGHELCARRIAAWIEASGLLTP